MKSCRLNLLQKYLFIPLHMFLKIMHNTDQKGNGRPVRNRLEAWLLFLCSDKPEDILALIESYPNFRVSAK